MVVSNRNILFQGSIFRCHVRFREGTAFSIDIQYLIHRFQYLSHGPLFVVTNFLQISVFAIGTPKGPREKRWEFWNEEYPWIASLNIRIQRKTIWSYRATTIIFNSWSTSEIFGFNQKFPKNKTHQYFEIASPQKKSIKHMASPKPPTTLTTLPPASRFHLRCQYLPCHRNLVVTDPPWWLQISWGRSWEFGFLRLFQHTFGTHPEQPLPTAIRRDSFQ